MDTFLDIIKIFYVQIFRRFNWEIFGRDTAYLVAGMQYCPTDPFTSLGL